MDRRLLQHYETELRHLREMAGEFARTHPKIAGRLMLDKGGKDLCPDPHVERLLEGFAWLAARVHLQMDAEYPRFTQSLFEILFPQYLAPTPSMAIVQFKPELAEQATGSGAIVVPRGARLRSHLGHNEKTPCTFRTAHPVKLLPIRITDAVYYTRDLARLNLPESSNARAALRLRLQSTASLPFSKIKLDPLALFLNGTDHIPHLYYEQLLARATGILIQTQKPGQKPVTLGRVSEKGIRRLGFSEDEALLPSTARGMEGYRLLREYFAFAQRFFFVELGGFGPLLANCEVEQIDIVILFDLAEMRLENQAVGSLFELFCTPVINLFPKQLDRVLITDRVSELHIVPDRNRPLDLEVYNIEKVVGYGVDASREQEFRPFFYARDRALAHEAFYTVKRVPRMLTHAEELIYKRYKRRPTSAGSEIYLSLVDGGDMLLKTNVRQLGIEALCTNRNLPITMAVGVGDSDFTMEQSMPVTSVRCLVRPTDPVPSPAEGRFAWKLISHLSLNYLSLIDTPEADGAAAIREMLNLYCIEGEHQPVSRRQIEGLRDVKSAPILRRINTPGPVAFARGMELTLAFDESFFDGASAFLLGTVMEEFLTRYVSLNSFTETVISTQQRGEIKRWPARSGRKQTL